MKGTEHNLITDLESKPDSLQKKIMIERAMSHWYHDFKSELPSPKMWLHHDCTLSGYDDIAAKVFDGEYDELD